MINAAIIGYGNIGPNHAVGLADTPYGKLTVVCDIEKTRAEKGAKEYDCRPEMDFDAVLSDETIDVVHICTPHYLHKDMAIKALSAGKHVVLEKPLAMNKQELQELVEAQRISGKRVCVMFQNRKNHAVEVLKEIAETKPYGKLLGISGFMTWERTEAYYKADSWRGKWVTEGGGALINQAVHLIDLMHHIGGEMETVKASISTKLLENTIEVEDTADALITYKSGIRGCFYATNTYSLTTPFQLVADFEEATLRYSENFLYEIKKGEAPRVLAGNDTAAPGKSCWGNGHTQVIAEFYKALHRGTEQYMKLETGLAASLLLYAMYESAKNGSVETNIN